MFMSKKILSLLLFSVLLMLIISQKKSDQNQWPSSSADSLYLAKGKKHVMALQQVLVGQLVSSITQNGTAGAVDFCQVRAIPLTNSISQKQGAVISRVTDRPRNPDNFGNSIELAIIDQMKANKAKGQDLVPELRKNKNNVTAYYPIVTNALCMQCHGNPDTQISPETMKRLEKYYPNDMATGYSENEVRGLWKVIMEMD